MAIFIALLRAVNVGGTGKLPMRDLAELCEALGFEEVRTYIQSGNVVFRSSLSEDKIRARMEQALATNMGKKIDVAVRTASELRQVLEANPFPDAPPAMVGIAFLSKTAEKTLLKDISTPTGEKVQLGKRAIYIYYTQGMGRSRLKLPTEARPATVRNINTVAKLVEMAGGR